MLPPSSLFFFVKKLKGRRNNPVGELPVYAAVSGGQFHDFAMEQILCQPGTLLNSPFVGFPKPVRWRGLHHGAGKRALSSAVEMCWVAVSTANNAIRTARSTVIIRRSFFPKRVRRLIVLMDILPVFPFPEPPCSFVAAS